MAYGDEVYDTRGSYAKQDQKLGQSIAFAAVYGLGRVILGVPLWPLMLIGGLAAVGMGRWRPQLAKACQAALALTVAQAGWIAIGVAVMPAQWKAASPDIVIDVVLVAWALASLSRPPVALLFLVQILGLGVNAWLLTKIGQWGPQMATLIVHIVIRSAIVGLSGVALKQGVEKPVPEDVAEIFA